MYPGSFARIGPDSAVASTTTINPPSDFFRITGTTNIATITPPPGNNATVIIVVPTDGTVNTVTTGNIARAAAMPINLAVVFVYSPITAKWYPGAIS